MSFEEYSDWDLSTHVKNNMFDLGLNQIRAHNRVVGRMNQKKKTMVEPPSNPAAHKPKSANGLHQTFSWIFRFQRKSSALLLLFFPILTKTPSEPNVDFVSFCVVRIERVLMFNYSTSVQIWSLWEQIEQRRKSNHGGVREKLGTERVSFVGEWFTSLFLLDDELISSFLFMWIWIWIMFIVGFCFMLDDELSSYVFLLWNPS